MKKEYIYPAVFFKDGDRYSVYFTDLDGCFSDGETIDEAYKNSRDALDLYLDEYKNPPKASGYFDVVKHMDTKKNAYVMLVTSNPRGKIYRYNERAELEFLTSLLKSHNITKADLAKSVGITKSFVTRIFDGERLPSTETAKKLGKELKVDWHLFYQTNNKNARNEKTEH